MDNKFTNIKERILFIIEYHNDTRENFFNKIGMTYGNFKGSQKNRPLNSDAIVNILSIYTDIDPEWLVTGKGDMLKQKESINTVNEPQMSYNKECQLCLEKDKHIDELKYTISIQRELIEQLKKQDEKDVMGASVADVG